jgi:hypothetical protein
MPPTGHRISNHRRHALAILGTVVEGIAFRAAALFPAVHILALAAVVHGSSTAVLPWLLVGHALAVVVGRGYEPTRLLSLDDRSQGVPA